MDKKLLITVVILFTSLISLSAQTRRIQLLNNGWKFHLGDVPNAQKPSFDDSQWEPIGLPHTFSLPYFMSKDFYTGYGWYRRHLIIDKKSRTDRYYIEFDGVFQDINVYVNETLTGHHTGGYTGFSVDITDALKKGDNVISLQVNNLWKATVAPRAGEHTFSGGVYRSVRLVMKNILSIDWHGVGITTPELQYNQGLSSKVHVSVELNNHNLQTGPFKVITVIEDSKGKEVTRKEDDFELKGNINETISQVTDEVKEPRVWSPESPVLYRAHIMLIQHGKLLDDVTESFGFRWFSWTIDHGFFLNGKRCAIRGVNVHQDQAGWGDAVTSSAMSRDVAMMKKAGFNFIRGSHYPHAPQFVDACDKLGIMFWSEAPFWGIGGFGEDGNWSSIAYPVNPKDEKDFEASVLQQLSEIIRIHRNHPSIVAWSMCNEPFFSREDKMGKVKELLKKMVACSHELDPTRPAAIGGSQRPLGGNRIDLIGDVAGYNGDGATQPDFQHPAVANIVSEYGSVTADRPGEYGPGWGDLKNKEGWKGHEWRSGQAIWCGFDHGSIAGSALGKMGIVDYFRIPKRSWYWYRNEYNHIAPPEWPVEGHGTRLSLHADKTRGINTDGTDDVFLTLRVLNADGQQVTDNP